MKKLYKILAVCLIALVIFGIGAYMGRLHTIYTAKPYIVSEHEIIIDYDTRIDSYYCE